MPLELGEEGGVFKKVSTRYEMPDGTKVFGKSINTEQKYFTKDILDKIDEYTKRKILLRNRRRIKLTSLLKDMMTLVV